METAFYVLCGIVAYIGVVYLMAQFLAMNTISRERDWDVWWRAYINGRSGIMATNFLTGHNADPMLCPSYDIVELIMIKIVYAKHLKHLGRVAEDHVYGVRILSDKTAQEVNVEIRRMRGVIEAITAAITRIINVAEMALPDAADGPKAAPGAEVVRLPTVDRRTGITAPIVTHLLEREQKRGEKK